MFTTYPEFKCRVQFDAGAPNWMAVELALNLPWFIAECIQEDLIRTFLLSGVSEVEGFVSGQSPVGNLRRLTLIFPPAWSTSGAWQLIPLTKIERLKGANEVASLVFLTEGRQRYGGHPIGQIDDADAGDVVLTLSSEPFQWR